jgi:hypothetical protein
LRFLRVVRMITRAVPREKKPKLAEPDVRGAKYLKRVMPLLAKLHPDGCARDKAGNRTLFYDQYASLVLLHCFSPAMESLRAIQQASTLRKVRGLLGCDAHGLSTLSEAARVFDPAMLEQVVIELAGELRPVDLSATDPRLKDIRRTLVLADGTLLKALPRLARAMWKHSRTGNEMYAWRMHCQFEVDRHVPTDVGLTPYRCQADEQEVLKRKLKPACCYVTDRGYFNYDLFNMIVLAGSDYVCRVRDNIAHEVVEQRPLTAEARAAGVVRDAVVWAGSGGERVAGHPVRLVWIEAEVKPRAARGEAKPKGSPPKTELLLIATSMIDAPAELIALIYQYRWTIEIFFRFFKHLLGCRHLISDDPDGITIQCYCAVIACLLLSLWTGRRKIDRATFRMVSWFLCGLADEDELLAHLNRPPPRPRPKKPAC